MLPRLVPFGLLQALMANPRVVPAGVVLINREPAGSPRPLVLNSDALSRKPGVFVWAFLQVPFHLVLGYHAPDGNRLPANAAECGGRCARAGRVAR